MRNVFYYLNHQHFSGVFSLQCTTKYRILLLFYKFKIVIYLKLLVQRYSFEISKFSKRIFSFQYYVVNNGGCHLRNLKTYKSRKNVSKKKLKIVNRITKVIALFDKSNRSVTPSIENDLCRNSNTSASQ